MAQTRRGAAAGGGNDTESGSGGSHIAGTGTGSTQRYKPKPLVLNHNVIAMICITWFSIALLRMVMLRCLC